MKTLKLSYVIFFKSCSHIKVDLASILNRDTNLFYKHLKVF